MSKPPTPAKTVRRILIEFDFTPVDDDANLQRFLETEKALDNYYRKFYAEEMLRLLPPISKYQVNGRKRAFSASGTYEYEDVYIKAEQNYRGKIRQAIKSWLGGFF